MIELIKQIAQNLNETNRPSDVIYGTVESLNPFSVRIDQKLVIPQDLLSIPDFLNYQSITIDDKTHVINPGLNIGTTVVMIRSVGGQSYLIVGRM